MLLTLVSISSIKGTCLSNSCTYHITHWIQMPWSITYLPIVTYKQLFLHIPHFKHIFQHTISTSFMSWAIFFRVSKPSEIILKPWSWRNVKVNDKGNHGPNSLRQLQDERQTECHFISLACFILRISYSCLNWLDVSLSWKYSLSNCPSITQRKYIIRIH
jgi:hypothetical protein